MAEIVPFPGHSHPVGGGGGPEDPMLEQRVAALEEKVGRIDATLQRLEPKISEMVGELRQIPKVADYMTLRTDVAAVRERVAEMQGRLANMPTTWGLIAFVIGSCLASAGLAFTIARLLAP